MSAESVNASNESSEFIRVLSNRTVNTTGFTYPGHWLCHWGCQSGVRGCIPYINHQRADE